MNSLCLHCGAAEVEEWAVRNATTPPATDSHFPIPHALLLDNVLSEVNRLGMNTRHKAHALTAGGNRYFGLLELERPEDQDFGLVIGLRNTHDKSYSAALVAGKRVFVCDNLAFSGEVLIGRKHTRHIERDLPVLLPRAFEALQAEATKLEDRIAAYRDASMGERDAESLVLRAAYDWNACGVRKVRDVLKEWREPRHEDFAPRTAWSLFNAFTEAAKPRMVQTDEGPTVEGADLFKVSDQTRRLFGLFDATLGLQWRDKDGIIAEAEAEGFTVRNDAR